MQKLGQNVQENAIAFVIFVIFRYIQMGAVLVLYYL